MSSSKVGVAIIGAGPYGLSIAAHLRARSVAFRIFGTAMQAWQKHMPKGMFLKSEGFASELYVPGDGFRMSTYCAEHGIRYADVGVPVALDTFIRYGLEFQRRYVPELEDRQVTLIERTEDGFLIRMEDGERLVAQRVVLATGIVNYASVPSVLSGLPAGIVSHSADCNDMGVFAGQHVTVLGAGASALDCAALAVRAGATVELVARSPVIRFHQPPGRQPRPLMERLRWPQTGLGTGWRSVFCTRAPLVFHSLPEQTRLRFVATHLGPAPGWFTKAEVDGRVPFHLSSVVEKAEFRSGQTWLHVVRSDGGRTTITTDRVVAATGYDIDVARLPFLSQRLVADIRTTQRKPVLSTEFESSVPGLYFVGTASAASFGPLARFAFGARFTAQRLSRHLAQQRQTSRRPVSVTAPSSLKPVES